MGNIPLCGRETTIYSWHIGTITAAEFTNMREQQTKLGESFNLQSDFILKICMKYIYNYV